MPAPSIASMKVGGGKQVHARDHRDVAVSDTQRVACLTEGNQPGGAGCVDGDVGARLIQEVSHACGQH